MMFSLLLVAGLVATSLSATFPAVREYPRLVCPEGWALIDRTCFLLADDSGTRDAGQSFCKQRSASLATITSQTQQKVITGMLSQSVWIGLKDLNEDPNYGWADGSGYSYASWDDGEPSNSGTREGCVEMRQEVSYMWNNAHCNHTKQFLCSKPPEEITTTTTTTTTPPPVCEEGWEMFEDTMCYKVSNVLASWLRAHDACLAQYAQLAAVTSEGQQNFLAALLARNTIAERTYKVWIGLNDREEEGTFKWQDGTGPGYTNWDESEPNNDLHSRNKYMGEDCVEMSHLTGYGWNDNWCNNTQRQYVCQKPPSKTRVLPSHTIGRV